MHVDNDSTVFQCLSQSERQRNHINLEPGDPRSAPVHRDQERNISQIRKAQDIPVYALPRSLYQSLHRSPGSTSPLSSMSFIMRPVPTSPPSVEVESFPLIHSELLVRNSQVRSSEEGKPQPGTDNSNTNGAEITPLLRNVRPKPSHHHEPSTSNFCVIATGKAESDIVQNLQFLLPKARHDVRDGRNMSPMQEKSRKRPPAQLEDQIDPDAADNDDCTTPSKRARGTKRNRHGSICSDENIYSQNCSEKSD